MCKSYRALLTGDLIRLIVVKCDAEALDEFHQHRHLFRSRAGPQLRFAEYLDALRERSPAASQEMVESAYEVTLLAFVKLPGRFPDILEDYDDWLAKNATAGALDKEAEIASIVQRWIHIIFRRACLEARRQRPSGRTRYVWELPNGRLRLWLPAWIPGSQRRKWLEEHVGRADPGGPGEQARVQSIIDQWCGRAQVTSLPEGDPRGVPLPIRSTASVSSQQSDAPTLGQAVADEKVAHIAELGLVIPKLGPAKLHRMILDIFELVAEGDYERRATTIAEAYRLKGSTFSRFAGGKWFRKDVKVIPRLWLNTALIVAKTPCLVEAAKEAGAWPMVQRVLRSLHRRSSHG